MPFLTACWRNLFLANFAVPPDLLVPRLPAGLELDLLDGQAYCSLVAFQFLQTRVLGIGWPGYRNFAELNLRFYVRQGQDRGVVFVREFVPQRLTAWLARVFYNEPYQAALIRAVIREDEDQVAASYELEYGGGRHTLAVTGRKPAVLPAESSIEHHFKEHHWGFGRTRKGKTLRYRVDHPVWQVYPVASFQIDLDWATVYGPEWGFLSTEQPASTVFAVGSEIAVHGSN